MKQKCDLKYEWIRSSEYAVKLTLFSYEISNVEQLPKERLENLSSFCCTLSDYLSLFKEPLKKYVA